MATEQMPGEPTRELRLEGFRLLGTVVGLGGLVLAAVVGAFLLGRWVERRSAPVGAEVAERRGPLDQVQEAAPYVDAEDQLTYFDDLEGEQKALEPAREVPAAQPAAQPAEPARPAAATASPVPPAAEPDAAGEFFVQVFAGRDRGSAESLINRLRVAGYPVRLVTEREGARGLFKVRVGGYEEARARDVARELQSRGFAGAWVTRES